MNLSDVVQSAGWKNFMAKLYGIGASVVIVGALFKINHWPGGSFIITLGLVTEAIIFFFSAFEPLHEELDWTLVYPELAGMSDPDEIESFQENIQASSGKPIQRIEEVLGGTGLDDASIQKLNEGFNQLGETAQSLVEISGATVATKAFVSNMENAATSMGALHETYSSSSDAIKSSATVLSGAYAETADSIKKSGSEIAASYQEIANTIKEGHSSISSGSKEYETQLSALSQNLSSLNQVYSSHIKDAAEQMQGSKELYSGLHEMVANLKASVDETNQYKAEIAKLKESISSLNSIYGNMLKDMEK